MKPLSAGSAEVAVVRGEESVAAAALPSEAAAVGPTTSHAEALKSTSIIGGATAIVMGIRMVRTKVMAVLLGPAGVGLEAIYDSIISLGRTITDLGISSSGVRQIAAAVGTEDRQVIARTVVTLRRVCLVLGILGCIGLLLARESISRLAFGHSGHASDIGLLSIILLLAAVTGAQSALMQGMRRIADLAKLNILGALAGAVLSIPIVYIWGTGGIAAYLVIAAGVAAIVAWHYARRVEIDRMHVPVREMGGEVVCLLKLGLVFAASGLLATGSVFVIRTFITHSHGVDAAGLFQAASALSLVYVGFVLQAMGTDFYPRLTAVAQDDKKCNQLVNEQAEISLLLALPGVLGTLAMAPWVIQLFYSSKFAGATEILCWHVAGVFMRVNSWPMGFILLAKGRGALMFWTDVAAYSAYVGLAWVGLECFGLNGVGMAFLGLYIFHWAMIYFVVRKVSGFAWSRENTRLASVGVAAIAVTLFSRLTLPEPWSTMVGIALTVVIGIFSLRTLIRFVGSERIEPYFRKFGLSFLLNWFKRPAAPRI